MRRLVIARMISINWEDVHEEWMRASAGCSTISLSSVLLISSAGTSPLMDFNLRRQVGEPTGQALALIRRDEDAASETFGKMDGQCFYFAINKAKSASRGFSDLFCLADWIDVFDQSMFDIADRMRMLNAFLWHYTITGADNKAVQEFKDQVTKDPPRQGGSMFTNERVSVQAQTPDFHGADQAKAMEMLRNYGLGGAGFPDWFFGDSGSGNHAVAEEMQGPTGKKIEDRQNHLGSCLREILDFVIESAIEAGVLAASVDRGFAIDFPALAVKDLAKGATTLAGTTTALTQAEDQGWIRSETAARAFMTVMAEIGVMIEDPRAEFQLAQAELRTRQANQQNALLPQSNLMDALNQLQGKKPQKAKAGDGDNVDPLTEDAADGDE
jgi:hypothetical protein